MSSDVSTEPTPDGSTLLERIAAGDAGAVDAVVQRYSGLVWSIARRLCRSADDAEDAVQEVFIEVWKHAGRFDPAAGSETTFIATITRRRTIDRLRRIGRRPQLEALPSTELPDADDGAAAFEELAVKDEAERVKRHLEELRPEQREVLELSIYKGLSHREIADQLDLPLGTVKTHVRRSLIRIRELIKADEATRAGES